MISSRDLISRLNTRPYKLGHTIRFKIEISFFVSVFNAFIFSTRSKTRERPLWFEIFFSWFNDKARIFLNCIFSFWVKKKDSYLCNTGFEKNLVDKFSWKKKKKKLFKRKKKTRYLGTHRLRNFSVIIDKSPSFLHICI